MYKTLISSLLLSLLVVTASAQNNETDPYIEVTGSSEMNVIPDIIIYTVVLQEYERDRKITSLDQIEGRFLEAVVQSGIKKENINVSDISSLAFGAKRKRKAFASKTYNLTFSEPKALLNFIDRLENLDIQKQSISRLDHTLMTKYRLDTKKRALVAAKNKASELLSVVDTELGKPLLIKEVDPASSYYRRNPGSNSVYIPDGSFGTDIDFKPIKIRFEIMARFKIN